MGGKDALVHRGHPEKIYVQKSCLVMADRAYSTIKSIGLLKIFILTEEISYSKILTLTVNKPKIP